MSQKETTSLTYTVSEPRALIYDVILVDNKVSTEGKGERVFLEAFFSLSYKTPVWSGQSDVEIANPNNKPNKQPSLIFNCMCKSTLQISASYLSFQISSPGSVHCHCQKHQNSFVISYRKILRPQTPERKAKSKKRREENMQRREQRTYVELEPLMIRGTKYRGLPIPSHGIWPPHTTTISMSTSETRKPKIQT